jgi:FtsP/CotA-like multicopper oxidase with cupredoxin domain
MGYFLLVNAPLPDCCSIDKNINVSLDPYECNDDWQKPWGTAMRAINKGDAMNLINRGLVSIAISVLFVALPASAQDSSIYVQCPTSTLLHPDTHPLPADDDVREAGIECDHLVAGDGMVTMADDAAKKQYIFSYARVALPADYLEANPTKTLSDYPGFVMETGMLAANAPAPTISVDEDDELFLSLTNVGMAMRADLFDPHTIHWHGFPQAASIFDGVPDSSISINMGASLTYYYNAKDAGTYMYHCHVEATEHMQMGMLGNLWVRPRQNKLPDGTLLGTHVHDNPDAGVGDDSLVGDKYAYNDGDGSTRYDEEYEIQMGSFDPDFHDASLEVQPLPFAAMKDRYFLLNGRGYPDTADPLVLETVDPLGMTQPSQPVSSLITAAPGQRILLRISNLNITQFNTLGSNLPMQVVALDARLLRDGADNDMYYTTNSLTLGGGQSADVIVVAPAAAGTYFLYTTNLDRLANDAENFGGMMTEIRIN